ncbi:MAG: ABC transporter substrate-binding protein [Pararhizobium sp.]
MKNRIWLAAAFAAAMSLTTGAATAADKIGGEINVLAWGDYVDFAIKPFQDKYGTTVNIDYYGSEQEAINKIHAAGLGTYDIVFLGVGFDDVAMKQKIIEPLDVSQVSTFKDLYAPFQKAKPDGRHYCMTYAWGANGLIAYLPDKVKAPITSWKDVFSGQYDGRIGRIDKANEQIWRAAFMNGYNYGPLTEEQWANVKKTVDKTIQQARTIYQHYDQMAQLLSNGEIWIADTDDGGFRQARAKGLNVKLAYPSEGFWGWSDGPCVVAQAPHPKAAYAFINFVTSPEMQAMLAKKLGYSPANSKAVALMDAETKEKISADSASKNIGKLQFQYDLGQKVNDRMVKIWDEAKAKYAH